MHSQSLPARDSNALHCIPSLYTNGYRVIPWKWYNNNGDSKRSSEDIMQDLGSDFNIICLCVCSIIIHTDSVKSALHDGNNGDNSDCNIHTLQR